MTVTPDDEPVVWAEKSLALLDAAIANWPERFANDLVTPVDIQWEGLRQLKYEARLLRNGGLPDRPPRRMPTLVRIADANGLGDIPHCYRCGYSQDGTWRTANRWLERAHVIDRCFGGLDVEANLRPLCVRCHSRQPIFRPGDEVDALRWFAAGLEA